MRFNTGINGSITKFQAANQNTGQWNVWLGSWEDTDQSCGLFSPRTTLMFWRLISQKQTSQKTYFSNVLNQNLKVKLQRTWDCLKFPSSLGFILSESCQCQDVISAAWAAWNITEILWRPLGIFSLKFHKAATVIMVPQGNSVSPQAHTCSAAVCSLCTTTLPPVI